MSLVEFWSLWSREQLILEGGAGVLWLRYRREDRRRETERAPTR